MITRLFVDGPFGQIHVRQNTAVGGSTLLCLHATAYSSRTFLPLMRELDGRRHVVAVDAPGYGESDAPAHPIDVAAYAEAIAAVIAAIDPDGPTDLFGYHTGVVIATELAIRRPQLIGRLVLMGVPYFKALDFEAWKERLTVRHELGTSLDQFAERWDYLVRNRPSDLSLAGGFANFVDELRAWPNGWWAHEAMFAYDCAAQFARVRQPVLILNPGGHLADASRVAAGFFPDASLHDMPELSGAVLDRHADRVAAAAGAFLSERVAIASAVG